MFSTLPFVGLVDQSFKNRGGEKKKHFRLDYFSKYNAMRTKIFRRTLLFAYRSGAVVRRWRWCVHCIDIVGNVALASRWGGGRVNSGRGGLLSLSRSLFRVCCGFFIVFLTIFFTLE